MYANKVVQRMHDSFRVFRYFLYKICVLSLVLFCVTPYIYIRLLPYELYVLSLLKQVCLITHQGVFYSTPRCVLVHT